MKISKTFRLSERAIEIINKQSNQSQYIEDLVLGVGIEKVGGVTEDRVIELINLYIKTPQGGYTSNSSVTVAEKPKVSEDILTCCIAKSPCKHWEWDGLMGIWQNKLSGEVREA